MAEPAGKGGGVRLLTVGTGNEGQRIDNYLLAQLRGVPRTWVYRVLRKGEVRVNKGRCKPTYRVSVGDVVRVPPVNLADRPASTASPGQQNRVETAVCYEDAVLLVVNKPSGMAVHGGSGLSHGVIESLRAARPEADFLELVHRLDRETSGCLMIAKRRSTLTSLQALQRAARIEKRYLALLAGRIRRGAWTADLPLRKNSLQGGERMVRVDPQGRRALTHFRVVTRYAEATLVEARLETGRTHQIRVHAAAGGNPILGDAKYGDALANKRFRELGLRRLFLHAAALRIPGAGKDPERSVDAPLPHELDELLKRLT